MRGPQVGYRAFYVDDKEHITDNRYFSDLEHSLVNLAMNQKIDATRDIKIIRIKKSGQEDDMGVYYLEESKGSPYGWILRNYE